jgi:hypothetical protein
VYDPLLTPERLKQIKNGTLREDLADLAPNLNLTRGDKNRLSTARAYRPKALYANPLMIGERWAHAVKRIERIMEGCARANNLKAAANGAEYGGLATRFAETWAYYITRSKPSPTRGMDHNPFRGLSDRDASRKFIRMVEDICDASTGVLGSWYTK